MPTPSPVPSPVPAPQPEAGARRPVYDPGTLAELEGIFGQARLLDLLARLKAEIAQRLQAGVAERVALGHDAHTLLSVSGSLGFFDLSQRCSEMEQACLRGADLDAPLDAARGAAARAVAAIDAIAGTAPAATPS
ncbi:Hpt domain-containing protein [Methylobacterium sp. J-078]|uniref:Hpt domain-containing protein n=1 Tax=Methylobacterium sp. J-078 TaxID=2836657 RepID=UPI001FBB656E|nr:Hpt domain-containing protein [Methylobacterium sp. J-078]MCJ2047488.1 Hpt domain-containing protein [Methylobacterium sp. J-078]